MQDKSTGRMHAVPRYEGEKFAEIPPQVLAERMATIIKPENQGATFQQGEMIEVKGARFVVRKIIKKGLVLHGVSSK